MVAFFYRVFYCYNGVEENERSETISVTAKLICILVADNANNSARATRNSTFGMHKLPFCQQLGLTGPVASKPMHQSHKTTPIARSLINAAAAEKKKNSVCGLAFVCEIAGRQPTDRPSILGRAFAGSSEAGISFA